MREPLPASEGGHGGHAHLHNHAQHCFAYLAESIICSADLTIEWARTDKDGSRTTVDGWGVPHTCKDPDAIKAWMEANHGPVRKEYVRIDE